MAKEEPALVEARKLKRLSEGRYPVVWMPDVISSKLNSQEARVVATLLEWEATVQAHDEEPGAALATGRGVLVAGRSIGDEPLLLSLHVRLMIRARALRSVERTLAQGTPPASELRAVQELLEDDEAQPLLLNALRGDRGVLQRITDAVAQASAARPARILRSGKGGLRGLLDFNATHRLRESQARALHLETECIEIAKLPIEDQARNFARLPPPEPIDDQDAFGSPATAIIGQAASYRRGAAGLRCAIVALALERRRIDRGGWPEGLEELTPAHLKTVPLDPFDGRPLRYKRLPDGVLVYSIGPDEQDDGGTLNRKNITAKGTDVGFRLWDVSARRQPAAEVLPKPVEEKIPPGELTP